MDIQTVERQLKKIPSVKEVNITPPPLTMRRSYISGRIKILVGSILVVIKVR